MKEDKEKNQYEGVIIPFAIFFLLVGLLFLYGVKSGQENQLIKDNEAARGALKFNYHDGSPMDSIRLIKCDDHVLEMPVTGKWRFSCQFQVEPQK
jgi:hypothetical protein